jgi:O-6-methylguanine DNA methyltransferase
VSGTPFVRRVIAIVRSIPPGRVATYGDIAVLAGRTGAARAVGNVMRGCEDPSVPCHRVIGAGGALGGYTDPQRKKQHLAAEGITFAGRRIRRFAELRWDGRPRAGAAARPAPRLADRTPEGPPAAVRESTAARIRGARPATPRRRRPV